MQNIIKKKYTKLFIPKLLDLGEIAGEYDIPIEELVNFHNAHCKLHELLTLTISKYVEYLYIPTEKYEERQNQLLKSEKLPLPQVSSNKTYGVQLKFPANNLKIHYRVNVIRTLENTIEVVKHKTFINNREIEHQIEQLSEKATKAMYPLQFLLDTHGSIKQIINQADIKKRWSQEELPALTKYYVGNIAEDMLKKIDDNYNKLSTSKELFERNTFFHLFFLPLYKTYPDFSLKENLRFYFPKIDFMANYSVIFNLERQFTQSNRIALVIEGEEVSNVFKKGNKKGRINLIYKFHKESYEIFSIIGKISCFNGDVENITEVQIFELFSS